MNTVAEALRAIGAALDERGAAWALVGGFAVSARCEPRFTRDVDVVVAVESDHDAEDLISWLAGFGYRVQTLVEQDATGRLATVRLQRADPARVMVRVMVDLLLASSGVEAEIAAAVEPLEVLPDLVVPVATAGHLVVLKLLARDDRTRPQDVGDLLALREVLTDSDWRQADAAVRLVEQRGYALGRDLGAALRDYRAGAD